MDTAPRDAPPASRSLYEALAPTRLSRQHGDNELTVASAMLTVATAFLTYVGGREAASETLRALADRVDQGEYPEPLHPAGSA